MKLCLFLCCFCFICKFLWARHDLKNQIECIDYTQCNLVLRKEKIKEKKFGEDMYIEFKEKEKELKETIKGIVIPQFLEENMDIDFVFAREFKITCKYTYKF